MIIGRFIREVSSPAPTDLGLLANVFISDSTSSFGSSHIKRYRAKIEKNSDLGVLSVAPLLEIPYSNVSTAYTAESFYDNNNICKLYNYQASTSFSINFANLYDTSWQYFRYTSAYNMRAVLPPITIDGVTHAFFYAPNETQKFIHATIDVSNSSLTILQETFPSSPEGDFTGIFTYCMHKGNLYLEFTIGTGDSRRGYVYKYSTKTGQYTFAFQVPTSMLQARSLVSDGNYIYILNGVKVDTYAFNCLWRWSESGGLTELTGAGQASTAYMQAFILNDKLYRIRTEASGGDLYTRASYREYDITAGTWNEGGAISIFFPDRPSGYYPNVVVTNLIDKLYTSE